MPAAQYAGFFHVDHILARQHGGGWISSARRDCFDHVIALNEAHVRRLAVNSLRTTMRIEPISDLIRTHAERLIEGKPEGAELESLARVGGLGCGSHPGQFAMNVKK
jgi:hypothetical protein